MEVEEIQAQACGNSKFPRIANGRIGDPKLAQHKDHLLLHHYDNDNDNDDDDNNNDNHNDDHSHRVGPEIKRPSNALVSVAAIDAGNNNGGGGNRLRGWHHSSRIIRVSRASGGKDRHSKVWTSKGLRDRRVRLSVTTAIQFYDLQDRLGYDQPSKAVEWLINAAADAIAELPSLNTAAFPDTPKQLSDEKRAATAEQGFDSADVELELDHGDAAGFHQQQHLSLSKSACSSTSETSKGSGLSLSRSEIRVNRVKARERARERAAKEKDRENPNAMSNINSLSQNASFTELLTSGINNVNSNSNNNNTCSSPTAASEQQNFFQKPSPATAAMAQMDYFATGLLGLSSSSSASLRPHHHHPSSSSGFPGQIHLGNSLPMSMSMSIPPPFGISVISGGDVESLQSQPHFSFVPEQHLIPVAAAAPSQPGNGGGGDYSLNFSIASSGLAGFNRGTLQSNSSQSSLLPHHLQRFSSPIDGSTNVPFFFGAAAAATAPPVENHHHHHHHQHHQFPAGFDGRLQLCYGDGSRHSDQKGKGKN